MHKENRAAVDRRPDMQAMNAANRRILMLQGPHGPFFGQLADRLRRAGAQVWRAGFNAGDRAFWGARPGYVAIRGGAVEWRAACPGLLDRLGVTDLVLYGDTRPVHAGAIAAARARGITVHVFEEGYLRPYWATYERGGANGHSALMGIGIDDMARALDAAPDRMPPAPAHWGDMRAHVFWGAVYHFCVLVANRGYPGFRSHRAITLGREFRLWLRRMLLMPWRGLVRVATTARVRRGGFRYHLALLQLEHDASFRDHSPFASQTDFIALCCAGFAAGAPAGDHLVFKAHPLEDGRAGIAAAIRAAARASGIAGRVHYLPGGKLAPLMDGAASAVTVNSTAGQQALWRGLPLRAFGTAVYDKPGLVSHQPLADFFRAPQPPDPAAYAVFRRYLLATSQIPGGFYGRRNRAALLQSCVDLICAAQDRYAGAGSAQASSAQQSPKTAGPDWQ